MIVIVKLLICLSLILTSQLNNKDLKIIVIPFTFMLRTANLSENLLILIDIIEEDEVISRDTTEVL